MRRTWLRSKKRVYYAEYVPKDQQKFDNMLKLFLMADDRKMLDQTAMLFILDMSFAREDIIVALGRTERERGWR